jgi:ABC-type sugar transport system permease subunit
MSESTMSPSVYATYAYGASIPAGGYVYSNYINKEKSWTAFTVGALLTALVVPIVTAVSLGLIIANLSDSSDDKISTD